VKPGWLNLYTGTVVAQRYAAGEELHEVDQKELIASIVHWRSGLSKLSRSIDHTRL